MLLFFFSFSVKSSNSEAQSLSTSKFDSSGKDPENMADPFNESSSSVTSQNLKTQTPVLYKNVSSQQSQHFMSKVSQFKALNKDSERSSAEALGVVEVGRQEQYRVICDCRSVRGKLSLKKGDLVKCMEANFSGKDYCCVVKSCISVVVNVYFEVSY